MFVPGRRISAAIRAGMILLLSLVIAYSSFAQGADFYRISILENQSLAKAEELKDMLGNWGYTPVILEQTGGTYRVLYGSFPSQAEAEAGKARLEAEGITSLGVVQGAGLAATPAADAGGRFTVIVDSFTQRIDADKVIVDLNNNGYPASSVRRVGRFYELSLGEHSLGEATELLKKLRGQGYVRSRVEKIEERPAAAPASVASSASDAPAAPQLPAVSPLITQSEIWKGLTEDQKRQVINSVAMQQQLGRGDALAQQVVDINKRLENLDSRVKEMVDKIQSEQAADRQLRESIAARYKEAENSAKAGKFQEAIIAYKQILEMDPDDRLGQRQSINRYISAMDSKLLGENYEGQAGDIEKRIEALIAEAREYETAGTIDALNRAEDRWAEVKRLNPAKYGVQADENQLSIHNRINTLRETERQAAEAGNKNLMRLLAGAGGAVVVGGLLLLGIVFFQLKRQESKLTEKVQAQLATQMRPMRELGGGTAAGGGLISGGGGGRSLPPSSTEESDSDIFAPRDAEGDFNADPLGGIGDDGSPKDAPTRSSDPFESDSLGGGGFDNLFGADDTNTPAPTAGSPPTQQSPAEDDIFGNLFDTQAPAEPSKPAQASAPQAPQAKPATPAPAHAEDDHHVPISFGFGDPEPGKPSEDTSDLLSMFDAPPSGPNGSSADAPEASDNPFEAMFEKVEPGSGATATFDPSAVALDEDTEIPGITLDINDPFAPVGVRGSAETQLHDAPRKDAPENDSTSTGFTDGIDLPSFSFDDMTSNASQPPTAVMPALDATVDSLEGGVALSFEDLPVGQQPAGWEGAYDYASLTVEADTPPRGSHQYLAFRKTEGNGKALYTHAFPAISGKIVIEFEMRCDDKNKFLLGFYIERDGDFQNSINTKILRSEAQTTPTIHMQGESAPYLLGSWAHIKYLVDLDAGLVNGYIDGTHMARDVPFETNPGQLNTLAIRDNINTTGVLLLNNVRVYPA